MKLSSLIPGRFVRRDNRFRVTVEIEGETVAAHLPNSGSLKELLVAGRACWLEAFDDPRRRTDFDLKLVQYGALLVSVDARLPNPLLAEALEADRLEPFRECIRFEREVRLGDSRLDFRLHMPTGVCWVEVKSVTLIEDGIARFPDAPTIRGARHVRELAEVVDGGESAAIVFVVQRPDAQRFAPHDAADPSFGATLRRASDVGVEVYAWTCEVSRQAIAIAEQIPVDLA